MDETHDDDGELTEIRIKLTITTTGAAVVSAVSVVVWWWDPGREVALFRILSRRCFAALHRSDYVHYGLCTKFESRSDDLLASAIGFLQDLMEDSIRASALEIFVDVTQGHSLHLTWDGVDCSQRCRVSRTTSLGKTAAPCVEWVRRWQNASPRTLVAMAARSLPDDTQWIPEDLKEEVHRRRRTRSLPDDATRAFWESGLDGPTRGENYLWVFDYAE